MPARIVTLAEAVKDVINGSGVPDCPVAERVQVSRYDTAQTAAFRVDVMVGEDRSYAPSTRGSWADLPSIDVQIYRSVPANAPRFADAGNVEGDRVLALAESLADYLTEQDDIGGFRLLGVQFVPMLDRDALRELKCAVSTFTLTFANE